MSETAGWWPDPATRYVRDEIEHLAALGFTRAQATRFLAVQLSMAKPMITEMAGVEVAA